jgi:hypothetical protein
LKYNKYDRLKIKYVQNNVPLTCYNVNVASGRFYFGKGGALAMREEAGIMTKFSSYVIDDGWNLPYEVMEEIEYRIAEAKSAAYKRVCEEYRHHKGDWLTTEVASIYAAKSWIYRVYEGGQYCGKVREIGTELQERYGVTELEAINILFEHNVADYVNRYYRMKNRISGYVDEQRIWDEVIATYLLAM